MLTATARVMAEFLRVDSEMGLTFSGLALYTDDLNKRNRATEAARKAFDTVTRLKIDVSLTDAQSETLERNLLRLRSELERLGQHF